ncbi:MAG: glycerophosphodiester phosphodiesterase family protein [Thermaerobacter sp.]|nr:glycerophosphodiester phosphodiesterase family protein [Thermaerobacter sp.]
MDNPFRAKPLILAHRGASATAPENTLAAFQAALAAGADGIECDCRLTADGQVVILHDATLERTTNGQGPVSAWRAADLARLDASGRGSENPDPRYQIPTLASLQTLDPACILNLELKGPPDDETHHLAERVAEWITRHGWMKRVIVSSFNHHLLRAVHEHDPGIETGALWSARFGDPVAILQGTPAKNAHLDAEFLSARDIRTLQAAGYRVIAWNVANLAEAQRLTAAGIDGLILDDPGWRRQLVVP